jgi:hypothetical protein
MATLRRAAFIGAAAILALLGLAVPAHAQNGGRFRSVDTGLCIEEYATANGSNLYVGTCDGADDQGWYAVQDSRGKYVIHSAAAYWQCWDSNSLGNPHANIILNSCNGSVYQEWNFAQLPYGQSMWGSTETGGTCVHLYDTNLYRPVDEADCNSQDADQIWMG